MRTLESRIIVPTPPPHPLPPIVNFSIFFHLGHFYSNPSPPTPPPPPPPPPAIKEKNKLCSLAQSYELRKHETHVVYVRSHSGYIYSLNICNENDYKTFWTYLCN